MTYTMSSSPHAIYAQADTSASALRCQRGSLRTGYSSMSVFVPRCPMPPGEILSSRAPTPGHVARPLIYYRCVYLSLLHPPFGFARQSSRWHTGEASSPHVHSTLNLTTSTNCLYITEYRIKIDPPLAVRCSINLVYTIQACEVHLTSAVSFVRLVP